jgi:hypothetical protein
MSNFNTLVRRIERSQQASRITREDQIRAIQDGFDRQMAKLNKLEKDYLAGRLTQAELDEEIEIITNACEAYENWLADVL